MIEINNISKVFRTSEVETVALNHVNLDVKEGEFVAYGGQLQAARSGSSGLEGKGTYPCAQGQAGIRVPELQPDRRTERLRECGTSPYVPRREGK